MAAAASIVIIVGVCLLMRGEAAVLHQHRVSDGEARAYHCGHQKFGYIFKHGNTLEDAAARPVTSAVSAHPHDDGVFQP